MAWSWKSSRAPMLQRKAASGAGVPAPGDSAALLFGSGTLDLPGGTDLVVAAVAIELIASGILNVVAIDASGGGRPFELISDDPLSGN